MGALSLSRPVLSQFEEVPLTTHVAAPERVGLHWQQAGQNLDTLFDLYVHLDARGLSPAALMNAGIYEAGPDGSFRPQGLHIQAGEELRPLNTRSARNANFYLKPNGVFYIDAAGAHVVRTEEFVSNDSIRLAVQSGPLLFDAAGLHPRFIETSDSRKIRNAVGVRADGQVVFALTDLPLNFWTFATKMRDEEGCVAALYMDGAISDLWTADQDGDPNPWQPYAAMLSAV